MDALLLYGVSLLTAIGIHGYQECKWNKNEDCGIIYIETLCNKLKHTDESTCKASIDQGQPCCMAGENNDFGYLCFNTSYDGRKKFHECLDLVRQCRRTQYLPNSNNASCAFNGKILDSHYVYSELQCTDKCMRDWRCVAYNFKKEIDGRLDCQLLGSVSRNENCNENEYRGRRLDREAFFKAYMNVNHWCRQTGS
ncbi:hypothetical protein AC249_AIPGENE17749 [Exaiptasia diaphana]|nr:hypothetical protein AC249_AIPGENE17749 [Exaiptasia diaphana]